MIPKKIMTIALLLEFLKTTPSQKSCAYFIECNADSNQAQLDQVKEMDLSNQDAIGPIENFQMIEEVIGALTLSNNNGPMEHAIIPVQIVVQKHLVTRVALQFTKKWKLVKQDVNGGASRV